LPALGVSENKHGSRLGSGHQIETNNREPCQTLL
jgi:hypothetical protein